MQPDCSLLLKHVQFKTSRSGGKGGQNVNKVETKVELLFDVENCSVLNENQKHIIYNKLANKIDSDKVLHIVSQVERSQILNKEKAIKEFKRLIFKAFQPIKIRKATKPSKSSKEERLKSKKIHSEKKQQRRFLE